MFLAVALTILRLSFLCWILFSLAVYALPFFAAVTVGVWAYGTGAGVIGAVAVGLVAGIATLVVGQVLFAVVRSTLIRAALALAFAAPAAVAGYHAVLGVAAIGIPSEIWRQVFATVGAVIVGFTAAARLTIFADAPARSHPSSDEPRPRPAPEPLRLPPPSTEPTPLQIDHR
jgi:hypothetical protein